MFNKRALVVLGVILVLAIGVILFSVFRQSARNNLESGLNPTSGSRESSFPPFTIFYPSDWAAGTASFPGGEVFYVKPASSALDNPLPSFSIEKHPLSDQINLINKTRALTAHGYKKKNIAFHGKNINIIEGQFPYAVPIQGKKTSFQDAVFVYPYGNNLYLFEYKYEGDKSDPEMEKFFQNILSSVTVY